jgi:hypothetical protein
VFDGDYGDNLPFFADRAVPGWRELIRSLDRYDFTQINLDVIGAMYEQLIKPEERHRFGQHYTQPDIVDLINSFVLFEGSEAVLDPSCGGGTFLVRSYARKSFLDETQDHSDLLQTIYGCDLLNYAAHLSLINLAIRNLIDDDNFPRIHVGDFLELREGDVFDLQPVRIQAGGLVTETRNVLIERGQFEAIIGNPPYIQAREMLETARNSYFDGARRDWPRYAWSRSSDIYIFFLDTRNKVPQRRGYLAYLTQAAWLDVEYGIPVQQWMLENFSIVAIIESEAEPWFTGARVATAVTILRQESNEIARSANRVRFVQLRRRLSEVVAATTSEQNRQRAFEQLRDEILENDEQNAKTIVSARFRKEPWRNVE